MSKKKSKYHTIYFDDGAALFHKPDIRVIMTAELCSENTISYQLLVDSYGRPQGTQIPRFFYQSRKDRDDAFGSLQKWLNEE